MKFSIILAISVVAVTAGLTEALSCKCTPDETDGWSFRACTKGHNRHSWPHNPNTHFCNNIADENQMESFTFLCHSYQQGATCKKTKYISMAF